MTDRRKNPNYLPAARQAHDLLSAAWSVLYNEELRQKELDDIEKQGAFGIMESSVNSLQCYLHKYMNKFIKEAE